jgi:hypothetical protein
VCVCACACACVHAVPMLYSRMHVARHASRLVDIIVSYPYTQAQTTAQEVHAPTETAHTRLAKLCGGYVRR